MPETSEPKESNIPQTVLRKDGSRDVFCLGPGAKKTMGVLVYSIPVTTGPAVSLAACGKGGYS